MQEYRFTWLNCNTLFLAMDGDAADDSDTKLLWAEGVLDRRW